MAIGLSGNIAHGGGVARAHERVVSVLVVLGEVEEFGRLMGSLDEALEGEGHELLVVYDGGVSSIGEIEGICEKLPGVRFVRSEGRGRAAALQTGIRAAAGDVVVMLNFGGGDEVGLIPMMAGKVREGMAVVVPRPRRVGLVDWILPVVTGMNAHDARTLFRAYSGDFLDGERIESREGEAVGLELTVKAQLRQRGIGQVEGNEPPRAPRAPRAPRTMKGESIGETPYRSEASWGLFLSGFWHALQAPLFVWGIWMVMIGIAVAGVWLSGGARGLYVNIGLLGAATFAFLIAVRRVRMRMRIADAFFPLVLLNPLLYGHRGALDKGLLATGILGLMAGAIIAMKRDNVLRYAAVVGLALSLGWVADSFLMLLPALIVWLLFAGYGLARSGVGGMRARGVWILGIGEVAVMSFGLACVLVEPGKGGGGSAESLVAAIAGIVDFPLLVLAIVMLALGWRTGPGGKTPPYFVGMLALLLGLLAMMVSDFQYGVRGPVGTDQTVLIFCLVYTVMALHGPRRLQWVVPPLLLVGAVGYALMR